MSGPVKHSNDDDLRVSPDEENPVREAVGQNAAHLWLSAETRIAEGILRNAGDGRLHGRDKLIATPGPLPVVPDGCVGDVGFRFRPDCDAGVHS